MLYRLIMCIAVIGLVQEAAAADIDTAYLRGSDVYQVQQVAAPFYPTSSPAALPGERDSTSSTGLVLDGVLWRRPCGRRRGHSKFCQSIRFIDLRG
jgi:hypothetical protein